MIQVYDFVSYQQPDVIQVFRERFKTRKPRASAKVNIRTWINDGPIEWWRSVMEERPLPGRAGTLPGGNNKKSIKRSI